MLRALERVVSATIWDAEGEVFATYLRRAEDIALPEQILPDTSYFEGDFLRVFRTIRLDQRTRQDGEVLGVLTIQSDLVELRERLRRFGQIVVVILLGALMLTVLVASQLQKVVSGPILNLASAP